MSENEESGRKKNVTAATTDAPQEEFISAENVPTKVEAETQDEPQNPRRKEDERP